MSGSENNSENKDDASLADDDGQCLANQYLPLEQSLKIRDENRTENKEDKESLGSNHARSENHEFDANKHPPDLFTGTFQEEPSTAQHLETTHEDADVYLSTSEQNFLHRPISEKEDKEGDREPTILESEAAGIASNVSALLAQDPDCKRTVDENGTLQLQRHTLSVSQDAQSSDTSPVVTQMQGLDNQGQMYSQQPTYVLLQTGGDQESGGHPQVFLAMQTGGVSGTDSQAYITLHPVSVEGQDLSGAFTAEGLNLQNAVLTQTGLSGDVSMEVNHHATLGDIKGLHLGQAIDSNTQMFISAGGQLVTAADGTDPSGSGVITYIQPGNSLAGGQTQVLMAVAEEDEDGDQMQTKRVSSAVSSMVSDSTSQVQKSSSSAINQSRRRLSNDPRTCDECGRTFKYPSDLKKHLQIHTDMKKFQCEDCSRCFRRLHQLNVHKRIHSGEKPYVCNRCGAEFRHDSTLTMHIRTRHDHLKPFSCDGCGKNFGRMSHLRKHQRNVCGKGAPRGNAFACKYCEESFSRKTDLRQHFISCDKKPDKADKDILTPTMFACEHCGKEFIRNYDFKRHQLSHTDEKPFACSHCAKNFKERSSLYKHVKRMHSLLPSDGLLESAQDDSIESDAAQRAIATITTSEDRITSNHSNDIIVSLSHDMGASSEHDTMATAHAFAHAGIIENADQILQGGHTIAAADILNFPEVAAALGLNTANVTAAQAAMAVEQHVDSPSIIAMDTGHVSMQDTEMARHIEGEHPMEMGNDQEMKQQFHSTSIALHLSPNSLIIDTNAGGANSDEVMVTHEQSISVVHGNNNPDEAGSVVRQQYEVIHDIANSHKSSDLIVASIMEKGSRSMSMEEMGSQGIDVEKVVASVTAAAAAAAAGNEASAEQEHVAQIDMA